MDDVKLNELSEGAPILAYKKFFGGKIYHFKHSNGRFTATFRVKDITLCYDGGYRIWCEILHLGYQDRDKINSSEMNLLQSYFKMTTRSDLNLCSIDNVDIVIYNREVYIQPDKSLHTVKGGYEFYKKSIQHYSHTSTKNDLESLMSSYKLKFY